MRCTRLIALVSFTFALTGCINSGTLIKVKPDGSGTIEQTLLMNMSMLKGMMASVDARADEADKPVQRGTAQTGRGAAR